MAHLPVGAKDYTYIQTTIFETPYIILIYCESPFQEPQSREYKALWQYYRKNSIQSDSDQNW